MHGGAEVGADAAHNEAAMGPDVANALAHLLPSAELYIVTAQHNNAHSAMVVPWVLQPQASSELSEPLGLTIPVAKGRANESLMQVGDSFVLNCLGEDYAPLLKHFVQRTGADFFEGVKWYGAPITKCPVLEDGIAYMECRVVSRLETPEQWITTCKVIDGKVGKQTA